MKKTKKTLKMFKVFNRIVSADDQIIRLLKSENGLAARFSKIKLVFVILEERNV